MGVCRIKLESNSVMSNAATNDPKEANQAGCGIKSRSAVKQLGRKSIKKGGVVVSLLGAVQDQMRSRSKVSGIAPSS